MKATKTLLTILLGKIRNEIKAKHGNNPNNLRYRLIMVMAVYEKMINTKEI